ncbi:MAG: ribonuclease [Pseudomonadota bacterium]|jgi:membrane protein
MVKYSIEWLKNSFHAYVTSPASNGAYAMSFLTIFATIPLLALIIYASTIIEPLNYFAMSLRDLVFDGLAPSTEADLMPIIEGFLSNAQKLGIIGALFGMYSAYLFFWALDYWVQTIFNAPERSDFSIFLIIIALTFLLSILQLIISYIKISLNPIDIIAEFLNLLSLWCSIYIMYIILPNNRVNKKSATIISAAIAIATTIIKIGFVYYVYYSFSYKTIYGSFATVMFLLIWIEICWWLFFIGLNALKLHK